MTVVVAEHHTPHPKPLGGSGDRRERGQRGKLVAKWLLDEMVAEQKGREARRLGATSRFHERRHRADVLTQEPEPKSVGHTPISSFQSVGCASMNRRISSIQRASSTTSTAAPRPRSRSSSPRNVTFSPTTTRGMRYSRIAPVHIAHGERVVYKTLRAYTVARSRPAFSRASISPWRMALPRCTRRLCPRPMI